MKIEKPEMVIIEHIAHNPTTKTWDAQTTVERLIKVVGKLVDSVNAIESARGALPKEMPTPVQPKPLRDGDMFIHPLNERPYCADNGKGSFNWGMGDPKTEVIRFGNILDLAQCVKDGGCVVALTKEEAGFLLCELGGSHGEDIHAKIAAAMETKEVSNG